MPERAFAALTNCLRILPTMRRDLPRALFLLTIAHADVCYPARRGTRQQRPLRLVQLSESWGLISSLRPQSVLPRAVHWAMESNLPLAWTRSIARVFALRHNTLRGTCVAFSPVYHRASGSA